MARVEEVYSNHARAINAFGNVISSQINYIVFEVSNEDEALQAVLDITPTLIGLAGLEQIEISERLDETTFKVNATYNKRSSSSDDEDDEVPTLSFSCGGGTVHLSEAYEQTALPVGKNFNPGKMIGWNGKGGDEMEIEGVDVPAPLFKEVYTKKISTSKLTTSYRRKIGSMVGSVNANKFMGWERGEVMFESISFSAPYDGGSEKVTVTFEFGIRPNEKNFSFAGKKIEKKGFEYLWTIPQKSMEFGVPTLTPQAAFKAQVCPYADFSALGL